MPSQHSEALARSNAVRLHEHDRIYVQFSSISLVGVDSCGIAALNTRPVRAPLRRHHLRIVHLSTSSLDDRQPRRSLDTHCTSCPDLRRWPQVILTQAARGLILVITFTIVTVGRR